MSKKIIIATVGVVVVAVGGYFGASQMGLLGPDYAAEAEKMAEVTCACEDFECTSPQIQWFNRNGSSRFRDKINALSEADAARYRAASRKAADCQNALRP